MPCILHHNDFHKCIDFHFPFSKTISIAYIIEQLKGETVMVKILIVYDSGTGNTEKMAIAVAEGAQNIGNIKVELKHVNQTTLEDLLEADGVIFGSPTYYGNVSAKIKSLIDESIKIHGQLEGKVGAAFTNSGGTASGAETTLVSIIQAMLIHGMIVQGRSRTEHYGAAATGSPNQDELQSCRNIGERTAKLLSRLKPDN